MVKNALIIPIFFFLYSISLNAQNQKIGYVDTDVILSNMPEYAGIEQRLNLISQNWQQEIREKQAEIAELERDFEAREILFSEEIRLQRLNEINQKIREKDRFIEDKFGPEGEYFTRQRELLEPIQRQIFDAITRVATRDNFDFVFDRAQDTKFLFVRTQWNLNTEVLIELGIDPDRLRN
jgi:outer membrane protein